MEEIIEKKEAVENIEIALICSSVNSKTKSVLRSLAEKFGRISVYSVNIENNTLDEICGVENTDCEDKNAALLAILYKLRHSGINVLGTVICDMDFCFGAEDIIIIADSMKNAEGRFVSAVRRKSVQGGMVRYERHVAGTIYRTLHGNTVSDAWTGLVGIPRRLSRAVYEIIVMNKCQSVYSILTKMYRYRIKVLNQDVPCPYVREPLATSRSRVSDIIRLIWLPAKFIMSSLLATFADYTVFTSLYVIFSIKLVSYIVGRLVGITIGFIINKNMVFKSKKKSVKEELILLSKYIITSFALFIGALTLFTFFYGYLKMNVFYAKIIADIIMFFANYSLQRRFVFVHKVYKKPSRVGILKYRYKRTEVRDKSLK